MFWNDSRLFGFSTRSLGNVMFSLVGRQQRQSERLSKTFTQHAVSMCHKPVNTLRSILVHPKDKTPKDKKCGVIYEITCDQDLTHVYIGETKRPLGKRFKEHTNLTIPTGVGDHCNATGHSVSFTKHQSANQRQRATVDQKKSEGSYSITIINYT